MVTLPALQHSTGMLMCGEDLGFLPGCVHPVMSELGIVGAWGWGVLGRSACRRGACGQGGGGIAVGGEGLPEGGGRCHRRRR